VPAIRERWFADDWEFTEGDVMDVEYRSGQMISPPLHGSNAKVANRAGELWRPKLHDPGSFTLELWLGTYQLQAQALWDQLLRAIVQGHRLITWRRVTAAGESRYCEGEVVGAVEPTFIGQSAYRASVTVNVPGAFWRGDTLQSVTSPLTGPATSRDIDLSPFSSSTGPLQDLTIVLTGGLTSPALTDTTERGRGEVLSYAGTIPGGKNLVLGCSDWSEAPSAGWTYQSQALNYTGDRFLTLAATPPGITHSMQLTAAAIDPGAQVTISGYRSYLC
jgi:hypothetical protein